MRKTKGHNERWLGCLHSQENADIICEPAVGMLVLGRLRCGVSSDNGKAWEVLVALLTQLLIERVASSVVSWPGRAWVLVELFRPLLIVRLGCSVSGQGRALLRSVLLSTRTFAKKKNQQKIKQGWNTILIKKNKDLMLITKIIYYL